MGDPELDPGQERCGNNRQRQQQNRPKNLAVPDHLPDDEGAGNTDADQSGLVQNTARKCQRCFHGKRTHQAQADAARS